MRILHQAPSAHAELSRQRFQEHHHSRSRPLERKARAFWSTRRAHNAELLLQSPARIWGEGGGASAHPASIPLSLRQGDRPCPGLNLGFHVHRMVFPKTPTWLLPLSTGFLLKCCFLRETFPNLNQPCLHPSHSGPPYPASPPSSHGSHSLTLYYRSSCLLSTSITGM